MSKIIIFGVLDTAELAYFYLTHDSNHEVIAFTVNREYLTDETFHGLPVVPFEEVEKIYSPNEFELFAPMTARMMNKLREQIYIKSKEKGYNMINYISSRATVFSDLKIGDNCFILEDNTIQPFTCLGSNIVLWSGNHIGHHSVIKDHVFFTSHVVLSGHCVVEPYCFFGVNATIRDGLHIAEGSLIAMGANVTKDTEPYTVYIGNPAKRGLKSSLEV